MSQILEANTSRTGWRLPDWHLAALLVLPQLPFWVARTGFSLDRPLFNLDMVLATLIACIFRKTGLVLLAVACVVDVARIASLNYHFVSPIEFAATAQFADMVVLRQVLSWKLMLVLLGLAMCLAGVARLARRPLAPPVFAAMLVMQLLDTVNGSAQLFGLGADRFRVELNIAGSPTWNIWRAEQNAVVLSRMPMSRYTQPRAFETITGWHAQHPQGSVLLILVESMGKPVSPEIDAWLGRRLETTAVSARWALRREVDEFHGPTTSGELRVLCGLRGSYTGLTPVDEQACLPSRWKAAGMEAYGLHGFHLRMFDRQRWWPRIGLTPWVFDPVHQFGCNGAFPGVCDDSVLDAAMELANRPGRFVYVLTLDTHLPLPSGRRIPDDLAALCARARTDDVACQMVSQLGTVLDAVATRLASLSHAPLVVVVGDHSPPFAVSESRQAFDGGRVPVYTLLPKVSGSVDGRGV